MKTNVMTCSTCRKKARNEGLRTVNKKADYVLLLWIFLIILSFLCFFDLLSFGALRLEYQNALETGERVLADTIYNHRLSLQGNWLYELPTTWKFGLFFISGGFGIGSLHLLWQIFKPTSHK